MGIFSAFLNPWLLSGLALLSAPIIIHILNKRRFQVHDWAAMDFLLKAVITNRRRIRLEDLILLLLRIALIAFVVLAVARPVARGLGGWREDERVVILDDSFSMDLHAATGPVFEAARESATNQIQDALGASIPVTLLSGSRPEEGALQAGAGEPAEASAKAEGRQLLQDVRQLSPTDLRLRFGAALSQLVEKARSDKTPRLYSVALVSDFRKSDWLSDAGSLQEPIQAALEELGRQGLAGRFGFQLIDVGRPEAENAAVTAIEIPAGHLLAGVPVKIAVEVKNFGKNPRPRLEGFLEVGPAREGAFQPAQRIPLPAVDSLSPGEARTLEVRHVFEKAGQHLLRAAIDQDLLPRDDESFAAVTVQGGLNVLILDGDPAPDRFAGESGYLSAALSPRGQLSSGISAEAAGGPLTPALLKDRDAVFLLNVAALKPAEQEALAQFLAGGGGAAFFLGGKVDTAEYRQLGPHLFPATLKSPGAGTGAAPAETAIRWEGFDHPALQVFKGIEGSSLERVKFARYLEVEPRAGAQVVARFADAASTPAIVESSAGPGKTVLFNTTADRDWSDWPTDPSFPIVLQEWVRHLAPRRGHDKNLLAGEEIRWKVTPGKRYEVVDPKGGKLPPDPAPGQEVAVTAGFRKTALAGFYRVVAQGPEAGGSASWFACRRDPRESDLEPLAEAELARCLSPFGIKYSFGRDLEVDAFNRQQEGELWLGLALGAAALLFVELLAAWWFGRR